MNLYSTFDSVSGLYGSPFPAVSDEIAIRTVKTQSFGNKAVMLNLNDFSLYNIGIFDDHSSSITSSTPSLVIRFKELFNDNEMQV